MTTSTTKPVELSAEQLELLARLQRATPSADADGANQPLPPIEHRDATGPRELSYAQRRLWFMHQMHEDEIAYSAPMVNRIRGPLDVAALAAALRAVVDRHEPLRTTYVEIDGEPRQVVGPTPPSVLDVVDVSAEPDPEEAAARTLRELAAVPIDLEHGPVLRPTLIRSGHEDHRLLLNIHHIVSDAWSMGVLVRELDLAYRAVCDGTTAELPPLTTSYAEYADWQRDLLSGPRLQRELDHWARTLDGLTAYDLPADRPRRPVARHRGATTHRWLPAGLVPGLRSTAGATGCSPFMIMLAAFTCVLARYTGHDDLAVGTSVAGRETDEVADLVGFFVNTLVLRTDLSGDPSFREALRRVRATTLSAHEHQGLPFDMLVEHLHPVRDVSRPPLVSVLFQQDNTPQCAVTLRGLDVELVDFDPGTTKFDLLLSARVWDEGVRVHAQYDTDLFDRETVDALLAAYEVFLTAALAEPDRQVFELPLRSQDDVAAQLQARNDTGWSAPSLPVLLHEGFERWAAQTPDAVAVVSGAERHTFAELDADADRLAGALRGAGIGPGSVVAVCLPRGVELIRVLLAVLKSGGAYVPIDPDYPDQRIAHMLGDSGASVLVTRPGVTTAPVPDDVTVVAPDGSADAIVAPATTRPVGPDDLCYVIYTSGSTGVPKGIALRHGGVTNNVNDLSARFGVGPGDAVLALSSPSFDMSVYELLGVPGSGGTVVLPDPDSRRDPAHWLELIDRHGVTIWNSAPALLILLVDAAENAAGPAPTTLRLALLGGDWIPVPLPDRVRSLSPGMRVISLGGATEASIHSTIFEIGAVDPAWTSIPYGRPMANQIAVVLDRHRRVVPDGVTGDLYLGGAGLARGYLGAAAEANTRFTTVDLPGLGQQRLYLTGDLARWCATGELELIGRADAQVKINGLRVELGEVEGALRGAPGVRAAAATVLRDEVGDPVLVGYVVAEPGADLDPLDVRNVAGARLPQSMVPARVVLLDALPLSANGKLDRRALPRPEADAPATGSPVEPPRGAVEEHVAGVWSHYLGIDVTDRNADFFDIGGDSFKAVRVARGLERALPVIEIFRNPTVASLARALATFDDEGRRPYLQALRSEESAQLSLVCVPYGGGNAVAYQPMADAMPSGTELWAVDLPGHDLADERPPQPLSEILPECAAEIDARIDGPVVLYGQCAGAAATVALACELESRGVEVSATFVGAALPDRDPAASSAMVEQAGDDQLLDHLRRLGGFDGALSDEDVTGMVRLVRHDLGQAVAFFAGAAADGTQPLRGPLHVVVGDDDPATSDAATRYREWGRFASAVTLSSIPAAGHYFNKHQPADVARIVLDRLGSGLNHQNADTTREDSR